MYVMRGKEQEDIEWSWSRSKYLEYTRQKGVVNRFGHR